MTPAQKLIDEAAERIFMKILPSYRDRPVEASLAEVEWIAAEIGKVVEEAVGEARNTTHCKVRCGCFAYTRAVQREREAIAKWVEGRKGIPEHHSDIAAGIRGKRDGE